MSDAIEKVDVAALYRVSTDVAGVCRDIVMRTAQQIQGRKYVRVEGWQAIATAHGCVAGARDVERTETGYRAIGEIRRLSDGVVIATAEGFVGQDEPTWFGGVGAKGQKLPARPEFACRAMAQTRAISRVCRSAFAHVVVLIDGNLSTTPAEEMEFLDVTPTRHVQDAAPRPASAAAKVAAALAPAYADMQSLCAREDVSLADAMKWVRQSRGLDSITGQQLRPEDVESYAEALRTEKALTP